MPTLAPPPVDPATVGLFPDVERLLAVILAARFSLPPTRIGSSTPASLDGLLPFCQVVRYGGGDDGITDAAAVDVDWFDTDRDRALLRARETHQFLLFAGRYGTAGNLIDSVVATVGPVERPRSGSIRRFGGSYTVSTRRITGS